MQKNIFFYYAALVSAVALIAICFMPWVHYNSVNETFTGWHVKKFTTGVYYGRPAVLITVFAVIYFLLAIWQNNTASRVNLFLSAVLFAYCIRTYILFTGSMFDGELVKLAGIYLIIILSALMLLCSVFPKKNV